jgi:hypothetical protein
MAISQPTSSDYLNSPDHSLMHRQIATDPSAAVKCVQVDASSNIDISLATDIFSVAWTDYFSTSTKVGWAAGLTGNIYYKKIGKLVFINFFINGTSNANNATFTLPYTNSAGRVDSSLGVTKNNGAGVTNSVQQVYLAANAATVVCNFNGDESGWATSNGKLVGGQFFYQCA